MVYRIFYVFLFYKGLDIIWVFVYVVIVEDGIAYMEFFTVKLVDYECCIDSVFVLEGKGIIIAMEFMAETFFHSNGGWDLELGFTFGIIDVNHGRESIINSVSMLRSRAMSLGRSAMTWFAVL